MDIGEPMLIPQVHFITNDTWELASSVAGDNGFPMVTDSPYGRGHLFVITIPNNVADLYRLPAAILDTIGASPARILPVRVTDGPSKVALYEYDNGSFVVESFNDEAVSVQVSVPATVTTLRNLETGALLQRLPSAPPAGPVSSPCLKRPHPASRSGFRRIPTRRSRRMPRSTEPAPEAGQPLLAGVELGGTKCICILGTGPQDIRAQVELPTEIAREHVGGDRGGAG